MSQMYHKSFTTKKVNIMTHNNYQLSNKAAEVLIKEGKLTRDDADCTIRYLSKTLQYYPSGTNHFRGIKYSYRLFTKVGSFCASFLIVRTLKTLIH